MRDRLSLTQGLGLLLLMVVGSALTIVMGWQQHFTLVQVQMLLRGLYAAFTGQYLPFGNESGLLGHSPGILSSWLMGFPFKLVSSASAPLYGQALLHFLALLLVVRALASLFAPRAVVVGTLFLTLGPWPLAVAGLNPAGFLSLGSALVLSSLVVLRRDRDFKVSGLRRFISTVCLLLGLGWCLQVHSSWPVLWLVVLLLWLRRDISLSLVGLVVGVLLVGLTLTPYLAQVATNPGLTQSADDSGYWGYGLVHVYPLFLGLLDLLRLGSVLGPQEAQLPLLTGQEGLVGTLLGYGYMSLYWLFGIVTMVVTASAMYFALYRFSGGSSGRLRLVRALVICMVLATLVVAALLPYVITPNDLYVLLPFALLPLCAYFSVRSSGVKAFGVVSLLFMVLTLPVMGLYAPRNTSTESYQAQVYRSCLMAFPEQDCAVYGAALPDDQRLNMAGSISIDDNLVARVLRGTVQPGQAPAATPLTPVPELPTAASAATAATAAVPAADSGEVLGSGAASGEVTPVAPVLPAHAPIVDSTPMMGASGELKLEELQSEASEPESAGAVVDQGSGQSGELVIN
ncbi:MAG TPA: hypothetical protein H9898_06310 [Candidatus Anaerobiospirillum stercoravium]|nr:hypothetical protein [Candidatus Anaerobiospirillum stercoravium]